MPPNNTCSVDVTDILTRLDEVEKAVIEASEQEKKTMSEKEKLLIDSEVKKEEPVEKVVVEPESEPEPEPEPEPVVEPEVEPVVEPEPVDKSGEPNRSDFDCPVEFHKAYTAWIDKEKEKTPVTQAMLDKALSSLKDDILKGLTEVKIDGDITLGEVVKKSIPVRKAQGFPYDYENLLAAATDPGQRVLMEE